MRRRSVGNRELEQRVRVATRMVVTGAALVAVGAIAACGDGDPSASPDDVADAGPLDANAPVDANTPEIDAGPDAEPDPTSCVMTLTAGASDLVVELCKPEEGTTIKHVQIAGLQVPAMHATAQVNFGSDTPPTSGSATLGEEELRILFYGGGMTPPPPPLIEAAFGESTHVLDSNAAFLTSSTSTVCFDVHDGGADIAPYIAMWVSGQKGADCAVRSTLTAASLWAHRVGWGGAKGAVAKDRKAFYRQVAGLPAPTITVSSRPALDAATLAAAVTCTTNWVENTDWQQLCAPSAGAVRHVRVEDASSSQNNSYWYTVLGQDANPSAAPAVGAGKLIVTGGRSSSGTSWTYFRFGDDAPTSTGQFPYATDAADALYTDGPSTVCYDLGQSGGNQRLVFWGTGANSADCADHATLTVERALYDSATDAVTGAVWTGLLATGKLNFVKTNNGNVSVGKVVVYTEPAAL